MASTTIYLNENDEIKGSVNLLEHNIVILQIGEVKLFIGSNAQVCEMITQLKELNKYNISEVAK